MYGYICMYVYILLGLVLGLRVRVFVFRRLSCVSSWSILDMNPLSGTNICKYLLTFSTLPFHFVDGCLCHWKPFQLDGVPLFYFAFVSLASGDRFKKMFLRMMWKSILPMFSSRSFMASGFTLKYLIYFEFVFVHGMRKESCVIFMHVAVQFS